MTRNNNKEQDSDTEGEVSPDGEDYLSDEESLLQASVQDDEIFQSIEEQLSQGSHFMGSSSTLLSEATSTDYNAHLSENYTSVPYGFQPKATYTHAKSNTDIMGVTYNGRTRQFILLDTKGATVWSKDALANQVSVERPMQYAKYEYRMITSLVYARKYNVYFALGKDFGLKVLNREFEEICHVRSDLSSILFMIFNPVRDELITGGVGGARIWSYKQVAEMWTEIKHMANYRLVLKEELKDVGGAWVKRVDLDLKQQHLYCCSDMDLYAYNMDGKLIFKFERAHSMSITGCVYSPQARFMVTASVDTEVKVWSITGGLVHTFRGHTRAVSAVILHPETSMLILTSSLDGTVRLWSLDFMDCLYSISVTSIGILWMGFTDDGFLYLGTLRNLSLWSLNRVALFWGTTRNKLKQLKLTEGENKSTRVLAVGEDSSIRIFSRRTHKNLSTVLPPPSLSPMQQAQWVTYNRLYSVAYVLINTKEIYVYTTRTDPACRIAVWDVLNIQHDLLHSQGTDSKSTASKLKPVFMNKGPIHRSTLNGEGTEGVSECLCLCYLNSTAMVWTEDEGFACPTQHVYLLFGLSDGRILFMDPVVKGKKYMQFKVNKDSVVDMKHDTTHNTLVTMCDLGDAYHIQIWSLPELSLMHQVFTAHDLTDFIRLNSMLVTIHRTGVVQCHELLSTEDNPALMNVRQRFSLSDEGSSTMTFDPIKADHEGPVLSIDVCPKLGIFCTCSGDGLIKIWQENKVLLTEIHLEESLCSACFLNNTGDLLVGFKNHLFLINNKRVCPSLTALDDNEFAWETDSEIYEDPAVKYEGVHENPDPVDLESYLVPFDIDFSKDFLEGKKPLIPITDEDLEDDDDKSGLSWAPTETYLSPGQSPRRLSLIDLTLTAEHSKYDLRQQMAAMLQGKRRVLPPSVKFQNDQLDEADKEMLSFEFPKFGVSPGPTPSPSTPSVMTPSSFDVSEAEESTEEEDEVKPEGFKPIEKPKKTSKPKRVEKPEPVKEDRSSEVEERIRISVKDRLDAIKIDSKSIIKEEAKKQAKEGKGKERDKTEDEKLLEQLDVPQKGREIRKKEAKMDRRRPRTDERRFKQELSQEDETATSDPETAIDVYVEEDDVKSGESTPKDKPIQRRKKPTKITKKVKDEEVETKVKEERKPKTATEERAVPPLPTTSVINMTPSEVGVKSKLSVPSSERRRVGQKRHMMIEMPGSKEQMEAPSGDRVEETEREALGDDTEEEQLYEGSMTEVSGRLSTEVDDLEIGEDALNENDSSGIVDRPQSSHRSVTSAVSDYSAYTGDTTQRSVPESHATSHVTSASSANEITTLPGVSVKVTGRKGHYKGDDNQTADELMDDLEDAGAMATRSKQETAGFSLPPATKSILRVKSAASSSRSPSVKFGLKDTGDESEGHDLDTESQGHSVARLDSPTSQSLDASEAPSTLRELHDITLPGYDIPEHSSSFPRSGSPTIYSDYGSEWTVPYSEDLLQDELGDNKLPGLRRAHTAKARPNTPTEGIPKPQPRPHTAHGIPLDRKELEVLFSEALKKYQGLPGTSEYIPNIYQKSANKFGNDYHEKFLERHHLMKMQRELRAQSASEKRQLLQLRKRERQTGLHGHEDCDKATHSAPSKTDTMLYLLNQILTSDMTLPVGSVSDVKARSPRVHPSIPHPRTASAMSSASHRRSRTTEVSRPHSHRVRSQSAIPITSSKPLTPGYTQHHQHHHMEGQQRKKSLTFVTSGRDTVLSTASQKGEGRSEDRCQSADLDRESRPPSAVIKSELSGELPFRFSIQIKPKSHAREESPEGVSVSSTPAPASGRSRPKSSQSVPVVTVQNKVKLRDERTRDPYPILRKTKQPVISDKDVRQMDPRAPTAFLYRPAPTKSIPNKCSQYILVNTKRRKSTSDMTASPLEEQLILDRFPAWQDKWLGQNHKFITQQPKPFHKVRYSPQTVT